MFSNLTLKKKIFGLIVFFPLFFYVILAIFWSERLGITGDEPHYLLMAKTLVEYGTLNLKKSYTDRDFYRDIYKGNLDPHVPLKLLSTDKWYSIHNYGFPFLLVPIYIASKITGLSFVLSVRIFTGLLFGISLLLIYKAFGLKCNIRDGSEKAPLPSIGTFFILTYLIVSFSFPSLFISQFIYPDIILFFAVSLAMLYSVKTTQMSNSRALVTLISVIMAILPWLHSKYLIISFSLLTLIFFSTPRNKKYLLLSLTGFVLSLLGLFIFYRFLYGSYSFSAPYPYRPISGRYVFDGLIGYFVDQRVGLFIKAPLFAFGVFEFFYLLKASRRNIPFMILAFSLMLSIILNASHVVFGGAPNWHGGTHPFRFLIPILPMFILSILCICRHPLKTPSFWIVYIIFSFLTLGWSFFKIANPNTIMVFGNNFQEGEVLFQRLLIFKIPMIYFFPHLISMRQEVINIFMGLVLFVLILTIVSIALSGMDARKFINFIVSLIAYSGLAIAGWQVDPPPKTFIFRAGTFFQQESIYTHTPLSNRPLFTQCGKEVSDGICSRASSTNCAVVYGPYVTLFPYNYVARFEVEYKLADHNERYKEILIDIYCGKVIVQKKVSSKELSKGLNSLELVFKNKCRAPLEFRVFVGNEPLDDCELKVKRIEVKRVD